MQPLEQGKLYQVYYAKEWRIAIYDRTVPAHTYKYNNIDMTTLKIGPERTAHKPTQAVFKKVAPFSYGFSVDVRGIQVRPVNQSTEEELALLQEQIKRLEREAVEARKELRDFCCYKGL